MDSMEIYTILVLTMWFVHKQAQQLILTIQFANSYTIWKSSVGPI